MKTLSGILDFSMGGFLCLRGYADYKTLSKLSEANKEVQRELIEEHKGEMASFLNKGDYRFFPEIVLSASLLSGNNYSEVEKLWSDIQSRETLNKKKVGNFSISVYNHDSGDRNRIAHITFDETQLKLTRIDGNHRLSAADEVEKDFDVPFCLILCQNPEVQDQFSRVIFHNINAKQIPLSLEENLKVILESEDVFPDEKLKTDPSFGWKYYLARKTIKSIDFTLFPAVFAYISSSKYSFFVELYGYLLENTKIKENEAAIEKIKQQITDINTALVDSEITSTTTNIAIIGALAYYRLTNESKYRGFLSWIKKNNIGSVKNLRISEVIDLYNEIYKHVPKKAFLARWYPNSTENDYAQSQKRLKAIKAVAKELDLELVDLGTRETGTFDIRKVMYNDISECDIFIADLSGARHNVMIEVGYALKHVETGRMVFYFQQTKKVKAVPFDVSHLSYDLIEDSDDIRTKTKCRLETILDLAKNGNI